MLEHWFVGCPATYVVCEDACVKRYVGHSDNIVTVSNRALLSVYPCICFLDAKLPGVALSLPFLLPIYQPLWILKTVKEKNLQRLVHLSSDLARHVAMVLENVRTSEEVSYYVVQLYS